MTDDLDRTVRDFVAEVAAPTPSCTGGTVCAVTTSAAAGLVAMCAGLSRALDRASDVATRAGALRGLAMELVAADANAYAAVLTAQRRPRDDPQRATELRKELTAAAQPPLQIVRIAEETTALAADLASRTTPALRGDAISAATLAAGAARGAATLVRINLTSAGGSLDEAVEAERTAAAAERQANAAVNSPHPAS